MNRLKLIASYCICLFVVNCPVEDLYILEDNSTRSFNKTTIEVESIWIGSLKVRHVNITDLGNFQEIKHGEKDEYPNLSEDFPMEHVLVR